MGRHNSNRGNGTVNFALPNLAGSVINGQGDGQLPSETANFRHFQSEAAWSAAARDRPVDRQPTVNLTFGEMAMHTHGLQLGSKTAGDAAPGPGTSSDMAAIDPIVDGFVPLPSTTTLAPNAMTLTGQGLPHDNT
jgi:microcystin-dependent protein